ncbi:MAG: hypothetical protein FWC28_06160 [Proteobacteria bacterium]|nr:hypothetical protein [Cystobacterineae bacterium]MCL2258809.1 hypothetical protein [Cystobacterineae bacterium]MCL2314817.1 hypothetical protein [Pseudomonadota bacterium]
MRYVWLVFALVLAACKPSSSPSSPQPLGEPLVKGRLSNLQLLPGKTHVYFLADAQSPQQKETASTLKLGKLYLLSLQTRKQVEIGKQVANLPETQQASADGKHLIFLEQFDLKTKTGNLHCADVAGAVVGNALGEGVGFFVVSPQNEVAFIERETLKLGPLPQGPFVAIAEGVANLEFSQDGGTLAFKKRVEEGGQLWVVDLKEAEKKPRLLADNAGSYRLSKDGRKLVYAAKEASREVAYRLFLADTKKASSPKQLSQEMFRFLLSPDDRWLAYIETKTPEKPGALWLRPLEGAGEAKMLGDRVRDFGFASTGEALAWREAYSGDEGLLALVELKGDMEPQRLAARTRHWQWNAQGRALAYTATVTNPEVSVDLFFFRLGDKAPAKIHTWVYEYAFSVDGEKLLFEANCTREGRSCELLSTQPGGGEVGAQKEKLADGVYSFKQSADGQRIYWLHITPTAPIQTQLWVTDISAPRPQKLADHIHLPPPLAIDEAGKKFLYISNQPGHEGLYLTEWKP